jgi:arabinose-5-phosphate isomerase
MMKKSTDLLFYKEVAQEVLRLEKEALEALSRSLDKKFDEVIDLFADIEGRVIVTGMGKSGLVGRKIASTFSSTGSPSLFLHPGEASHGDLGMITKKDVLLALSNSGETQELADVITYTRRHGIPLVSITQGAKSALAQESDLTLLLPSLPEACPNGLAPTTSTMMMMALGDALAVALLKKRAFSKEDFKALHPGGRLGARLRRVKELMHTEQELPLVEAGALMSDALLEMTSKSFGCVGIVDPQGVLIGIITDGDLRRHMSTNLIQQNVDNVMTFFPKTVSGEMLLEEALHIMEGRVTVLFVVDEHQRPVGLLHIHDLLRIGMI